MSAAPAGRGATPAPSTSTPLAATAGISVAGGAGTGALDIDVELHVDDGEILAVIGPNGAGKSTVLEIVAGLRALDRGRVSLGTRVVDDPGAGIFVPPPRRDVGMVFQDLHLFPRLTIGENVTFALHARGQLRTGNRRQAETDTHRAAARELLGRVGLADRAGDLPASLSGGEAQRVAIARALAHEPSTVLLDEPLSALDATVRDRMRALLRETLARPGRSSIVVTHDPVDAAVVADRIAVVESGSVAQCGSYDDLARAPATPYVADVLGVDLVWGHADGAGTVTLTDGFRLVVTAADRAGAVAVGIRPRAVALHRERPDGSPRNCWPVTVVDVDTWADRVRVRLDGPVPCRAEITVAAASELAVAPGSRLWASVKAVDLDVRSAPSAGTSGASNTIRP